jgi:hypothetical protein
MLLCTAHSFKAFAYVHQVSAFARNCYSPRLFEPEYPLLEPQHTTILELFLQHTLFLRFRPYRKLDNRQCLVVGLDKSFN